MNRGVVIDSTNFSYFCIEKDDISIFDGTTAYPISFNEYLKFMGKLAYVSNFVDCGTVTIDLVPELLAASIIMRKDTNWKIIIDYRTKEYKYGEITSFISPKFESSNEPMFNFIKAIAGESNTVHTYDYRANEIKKIHCVKEVNIVLNDESDGDDVLFSLSSGENVFNVSLEMIKTLKDCPEGTQYRSFLPFIKSLIKRGLYVEYDFVKKKSTNYTITRLVIKEKDTETIMNEHHAQISKICKEGKNIQPSDELRNYLMNSHIN